MPYLSTSQEWLHQSSLLIQARPRTTKITTKYTIQRPTKRRKRSPSIEPGATTDDTTTSSKKPATSTQTTSASTSTQPMGSLVLKTFDPESGTCLKYRTDKAAEVGRLVASLGRLGRGFCGLAVEENEGQNTGPEQREAIPAESNVAPKVEGNEAGISSQKRDAVVTETKGDAKGGGTGKKRKKGKK